MYTLIVTTEGDTVISASVSSDDNNHPLVPGNHHTPVEFVAQAVSAGWSPCSESKSKLVLTADSIQGST